MPAHLRHRAPVALHPDHPADRTTRLSDCVWTRSGDIGDALEASVQPASTPRATAISAFASEYGCDFTEVGCWKRYGRLLTAGEVWEDHGGQERWADEFAWSIDRPPGVEGWTTFADLDELGVTFHPPPSPAPGWEPDWDTDPAWTFVPRGTPGAQEVWILGLREDGPPQKPRRTTA